MKVNQLMFLLLIPTVFYTCKKDSSAINPSEEVAGYSHFYDINGIKSTDNSGIIVSLEGLSISTTTKSNGSWSFYHLESGTYTLVFSKPGVGTMKITDKKLVGGYNFLDTISLYPAPQYNIYLTDVSATSGNTFHMSGYFTGELTQCPCCHVFFGKTSDVSSATGNYLLDIPIFAPGAEPGIFGGFDSGFTDQILRDKGFYSGDSIYITAYPDFAIAVTYNSWDVGYYYESNKTSKVYPNLNPNKSNTLSFVLP